MDFKNIDIYEKVKTVPMGRGARREFYHGTHEEKGGRYGFRRTVGAGGNVSWSLVSRNSGTTPIRKEEAESLEKQV